MSRALSAVLAGNVYIVPFAKSSSQLSRLRTWTAAVAFTQTPSMAANLTAQQLVAGTTRQLTSAAHRPERSRSKVANAPSATPADSGLASRSARSAQEALQASSHQHSHAFVGPVPNARPAFRYLCTLSTLPSCWMIIIASPCCA